MEDWVKGLTRDVEDEADKRGIRYRWEEIAVERKWRWTGHILRRPGRRTADVIKANPRDGGRTRRLAGGQKKRWAWLFKELLGDDWQAEATEREQWRLWGDEAVSMMRQKLERR